MNSGKPGNGRCLKQGLIQIALSIDIDVGYMPKFVRPFKAQMPNCSRESATKDQREAEATEPTSGRETTRDGAHGTLEPGMCRGPKRAKMPEANGQPRQNLHTSL